MTERPNTAFTQVRNGQAVAAVGVEKDAKSEL